jgi:hypothetical protein
MTAPSIDAGRAGNSRPRRRRYPCREPPRSIVGEELCGDADVHNGPVRRTSRIGAERPAVASGYATGDRRGLIGRVAVDECDLHPTPPALGRSDRPDAAHLGLLVGVGVQWTARTAPSTPGRPKPGARRVTATWLPCIIRVLPSRCMFQLRFPGWHRLPARWSSSKAYRSMGTHVGAAA